MNPNPKNTYLSPKETRNPERFPSITQPKIVGFFSLNGSRDYSGDARNCKYVYKGIHSDQPDIDLNAGIENVIRKIEFCQNEKLTHLLQYILENIIKLKNEGFPNTTQKILTADFVCFRGLLRQLMCTPYEYREPWIILATKFKGTIYLCAEETEKRTQEKLSETDAMKKILSYGFKFEQCVLTDDPEVAPNTSVPVNENEEFCCMFSTDLNGQSLLYGAEMDGIESSVRCDLNSIDLNECNFVELKVKLREQNERQKTNYHRFKLRNWWCQTFLANIQKIIVGTRNSNGIIENISNLSVKDIPKQNRNYWSPSVCMEFCAEFLRYVSQEMIGNNDPSYVCRFEYDPIKSNNIFVRKYFNQNEYSILPEWFTEKINKQCET